MAAGSEAAMVKQASTVSAGKPFQSQPRGQRRPRTRTSTTASTTDGRGVSQSTLGQRVGLVRGGDQGQAADGDPGQGDGDGLRQHLAEPESPSGSSRTAPVTVSTTPSPITIRPK